MHFVLHLAADPSPASTLEIWTRWSLQMATIVTGFVVSIYALLRKSGGIEKKVDKAAVNADRAAKLAEPTSNGFAKSVLESQEQILVWLQKLSDRQDEDRATMTRHLELHVDRKEN